MRLRVSSSATAFAPFSQNSASFRCVSGLGHAQLWQSKPLVLLIAIKVRKVLMSPISRPP
jgi:hypothetical protein